MIKDNVIDLKSRTDCCTGPVGIQGPSPSPEDLEKIEKERLEEIEYIKREGRDALIILSEVKLARRWRLNHKFALAEILSLWNLPVYVTSGLFPSMKYYRLSEVKKFEMEHKDILKKIRLNFFSYYLGLGF